MLRLLLLSSLLLSGCSQHFGRCAFGAETEAGAYACAVQNFGEVAWREHQEREALCDSVCCSLKADAAWCAVNCE